MRQCWVVRDVCHADGASSGELACHPGNIEGVCILDVRGKHVNMENDQSFPSLASIVPGLGILDADVFVFRLKSAWMHTNSS